MPLTIIRDDITKLDVDAIVNAANTELQAGGGVCGAIFSAAGHDKLQKDCDKLAPIKFGEAAITKGYALKAKYIVHAAGPIYRDGKSDEEQQLYSCYKNSLDIAAKHKCESIAFPLISSGIYGYPKDEALTVATKAIGDWLMTGDMDVSLVVFDKAAFSLAKDLHGEIKTFIDENYVVKHVAEFEGKRSSYESSVFLREDTSDKSLYTEAIKAPQPSMDMDMKPSVAMRPSAQAAKSGFDVQLDEPFSAALLRLIDQKGKTDVETYKRANIDRKLFSKIRSGKGYMPSKKTAVALAVSLELSLAETRELLERAGFALSRSVMFDVIVEYFITRRKYDIFEINNVLFEYDQQLLGG